MQQLAAAINAVFEADKAQQTKDKKKPVAIKCATDAMECFFATQMEYTMQEYIGYVGENEESDEQGRKMIHKIEILVEPTPAMFLMGQAREKAAGGKNAQVQFGVSKQLFNSAFEKTMPNVAEYAMYGVWENDGENNQQNIISEPQSIQFVPFDAKFLNDTNREFFQDIEAAAQSGKGGKPNPQVDYADGKPNRVY